MHKLAQLSELEPYWDWVYNMEQMSDQINEIATALALAQSELDSAKKDNSGYGYKYSDLATVIETAKPILARNGLSVTQLVGHVAGGVVNLTTVLSHKSGQFFRSSASIPLVEMKGCNVAQSAGSSLSYLRRYSYQAILGMASEDNDASSEGFKSAAKSEVKSSAPVKTETVAAPEPERQRFRRPTTDKGGF